MRSRIISVSDAVKLREGSVAAVFTPKDFDLTDVLAHVAELAADRLQPA